MLGRSSCSRCLAALRPLSRNLAAVRQSPGFRKVEHGLEWHPTKETLLNSNPGAVLVAASYEPRSGKGAPKGKGQPVRKFSSFRSHEDFWRSIQEHSELGKLHNFHEIFPRDAPRCLYFDIDGALEYKEMHQGIVPWLRQYVRWFFSGDRLDWAEEGPEAVVLRSSDPSKYSCHVVFPQIQFDSHEDQENYIKVLLNGLSALKAEVAVDGRVESVPILERIVDRAPYTSFQLFRGPYACKLKQGQLLPETCLEPEGFFQDVPFTSFAGYVDRSHQLRLPTVGEVLAWNEELSELHLRSQRSISSAAGPWKVSPLDESSLFLESFQVRQGGGTIDLRGMTDLETYEACLRLISGDRASQWWSWFRISGVTRRMLERYSESRLATARIWRAHMEWSRRYPGFCEEENVRMVERPGGRASGLHLLRTLVRYDNPDMQVRTWRDGPE